MNDWVIFAEGLDPVAAESVAGSKLARLAELSGIGVPVPQFFAITAGAFRARDDASGPIREAIEDAYRELSRRSGVPEVRTAVRSSAIGEDSRAASFAGMFDTILGVAGADAVVAAVHECWQSLTSARATAYRDEHHIRLDDIPMAVGVCELIPARCAGVAFSAHPVTGKRDRVVIEANWGWGESVVGGTVDPDRIEIDSDDRRILSYEVGAKQAMSSWDCSINRVAERATPDELRNRRALTDDAAYELAEVVRRVEDHYGYPVDLEWVADERGPLVIVQVRPITTAAGTGSAGWDPAGFAAKYAFGQG
jgi:pyruvate,water dikinase